MRHQGDAHLASVDGLSWLFGNKVVWYRYSLKGYREKKVRKGKELKPQYTLN